MCRRKVPGVLASLIALAAMAACSGTGATRRVAAGQAAGQVAASLSATYGVQPPLVRCPESIEVVAGRSFDCATVLDGQPLTVHVTLVGTNGQISEKLGAAVLIVQKIVAGIKANVEQQSGVANAAVDCGRHVLLVEQPGQSFTCNTVTGSVSRAVAVNVMDLSGNVRYGAAGPATPTPGGGPAGSTPAGARAPPTIPGGG